MLRDCFLSLCNNSIHAHRILPTVSTNRTAADFVRLLSAYAVQALLDVRAPPYSPRQPHFYSTALRSSLQAAGVEYFWAGLQLGGMRMPEPSSPHTTLSQGLRGCADHMASASFARAIDQLRRFGLNNFSSNSVYTDRTQISPCPMP